MDCFHAASNDKVSAALTPQLLPATFSSVAAYCKPCQKLRPPLVHCWSQTRPQQKGVRMHCELASASVGNPVSSSCPCLHFHLLFDASAAYRLNRSCFPFSSSELQSPKNRFATRLAAWSAGCYFSSGQLKQHHGCSRSLQAVHLLSHLQLTVLQFSALHDCQGGN